MNLPMGRPQASSSCQPEDERKQDVLKIIFGRTFIAVLRQYLVLY